MSVLIISPQAWDAHPVSKHNYALTLAERGVRVLFLDPPTDGIPRTVTPVPDVPGLEVVRGPQVMRGLRYLPRVLRNLIEARWLVDLERRTGERIETVWLFENSRFFDMRFAADRLKIYHQVDLVEDHHPRVAARTADIALCTTDAIAAHLAGEETLVVKVHHGTVLHTDRDLPPEMANAFDPCRRHATLLGNLEMALLDYATLLRMVIAHPDIIFHFMGDAKAQTPLRIACEGCDNVMWWGRVAPHHVPALLKRSDILLLAYRASEYADQLASPHKLMEYLLSGRPIVASWTAEYADKPGLIEMVSSDGDLAALFKQVIDAIDIYDAPDRQTARRTFALDHTYGRQLNRIGEHLRDARLPVPFPISDTGA